MKLTLWLVSIVLLCRALPLLADTGLLLSVSGRLTTGQQLQGRFDQQKSLPFLALPLNSSGDFSLDSDRGLYWRVLKPVKSEMTVDASGVQLDGHYVRDHGAGDLIASLMRAFMTGDLSGVQRTFAVSGEHGDEEWRLILKPRGAVLRSVLKKIEVSGDSYLARVIIFETSESVTRIRLIDVSQSKGEEGGLHANSP